MFDYKGKASSQGGYTIPRTCGKCSGRYWVNDVLKSQPVKCPHCGFKNS